MIVKIYYARDGVKKGIHSKAMTLCNTDVKKISVKEAIRLTAGIKPNSVWVVGSHVVLRFKLKQ